MPKSWRISLGCAMFGHITAVQLRTTAIAAAHDQGFNWQRAWIVHATLLAALFFLVVLLWPWFARHFYNYISDGLWPPSIFIQLNSMAGFINSHSTEALLISGWAIWWDRRFLRSLIIEPRLARSWSRAIAVLLAAILLTMLYGLLTPGIMLLQVHTSR